MLFSVSERLRVEVCDVQSSSMGLLSSQTSSPSSSSPEPIRLFRRFPVKLERIKMNTMFGTFTNPDPHCKSVFKSVAVVTDDGHALRSQVTRVAHLERHCCSWAWPVQCISPHIHFQPYTHTHLIELVQYSTISL